MNFQQKYNENCNGLIFSPLSGNEPEYNVKKWEKNQKNNNCYAYSVNDHKSIVKERHRKSIPGNDLIYYRCSDVVDGMYGDIPGIYPTTFECQCNPGFTKIFAAVSDNQNMTGKQDGEKSNDFHFWRQDGDRYWSHKIGAHPPSRVDASGKMIINPELSDRKFKSHNYSTSCGFFCVPLQEKILE